MANVLCVKVLAGEIDLLDDNHRAPNGFSTSGAVEGLINAESCKIFGLIDSRTSRKKYEGGAAYVMKRSSWVRLIPAWLSLMPVVHEKYYSGIESDMFAWMMASALLGIEYNIRSDLMRTCMWSERDERIITDEIFIHYCQRYFVFETRTDNPKILVNHASEFLSGEDQSKAAANPELEHVFAFSKYWMQARRSQQWIIECEAPILVEPPDVAASTLSKKMFNHYKVLKELVPAINNGLTAYKNIYCAADKRNVKKRVILHESHKENDHLLNSII